MSDIDRYEGIVERINARLRGCAGIADITTPGEDWSIKELVAHLVDSASNNHQRFIRLQQTEELVFPGYDAEEWRRISKAAGMDYMPLVDLWYSYNRYLLGIIARADPGALENVWISGDGRTSLGFLIEDYYAHLIWHEDLFIRIQDSIGASRGS